MNSSRFSGVDAGTGFIIVITVLQSATVPTCLTIIRLPSSTSLVNSVKLLMLNLEPHILYKRKSPQTGGLTWLYTCFFLNRTSLLGFFGVFIFYCFRWRLVTLLNYPCCRIRCRLRLLHCRLRLPHCRLRSQINKRVHRSPCGL